MQLFTTSIYITFASELDRKQPPKYKNTNSQTYLYDSTSSQSLWQLPFRGNVFSFRPLGIPADRPSKDQMLTKHKEFIVCAHTQASCVLGTLHIFHSSSQAQTEQMFAPKSCKWTTNLLSLRWSGIKLDLFSSLELIAVNGV